MSPSTGSQTFLMSPSPAKQSQQLDLQSRTAIPPRRYINGLQVFHSDIPPAAQKRYVVFRERLRDGLHDYLRAKGKPTRGLSITLRNLGENERRANTWFVVFCQEAAQRRTKRYLYKPDARSLWQDSDTAGIHQATVVPLPVEATA